MSKLRTRRRLLQRALVVSFAFVAVGVVLFFVGPGIPETLGAIMFCMGFARGGAGNRAELRMGQHAMPTLRQAVLAGRLALKNQPCAAQVPALLTLH